MQNNTFLSCRAGCVEGDKLYVVHDSFPILLEYNLFDMTYVIKSYNVMPYRCLENGIVSVFKKGNLFFIVLNGSTRNIIVYDISTDSYSEYMNNYSDSRNIPIWYAYLYKGDIYIFPVSLTDEYAVFSTEKMAFVKGGNINCNYLVGKDKKEFQYGRILVHNDTLFVFPLNSRFILHCDFAGKELARYELPEECAGIENLAFYDGKVYFYSYNDRKIRVWTHKHGVEYEYVCNAIKKNCKYTISIFNIYVNEMAILSIPTDGYILSYINKSNGIEKAIDISAYVKRVKNDELPLYVRGKVIDNQLLLFPYAADCFLWIDMSDGTVHTMKCRINETDYANFNMISIINSDHSMLYESEKGSLRTMLFALVLKQ